MISRTSRVPIGAEVVVQEGRGAMPTTPPRPSGSPSGVPGVKWCTAAANATHSSSSPTARIHTSPSLHLQTTSTRQTPVKNITGKTPCPTARKA